MEYPAGHFFVPEDLNGDLLERTAGKLVKEDRGVLLISGQLSDFVACYFLGCSDPTTLYIYCTPVEHDQSERLFNTLAKSTILRQLAQRSGYANRLGQWNADAPYSVEEVLIREGEPERMLFRTPTGVVVAR